ncbi:RNA polymerase I-specific transcription initiation factor-domain-containing protein [Aspergillus crustosus]
MSFDSHHHSRHSSVPPSAQPYQSLFGGSSQGAFEQESYWIPQQDGALGDSDLFGAIGSGGRKVEYEDSEVDLAYLPSGNETSESESALYTVPKHEDPKTQPSARIRGISLNPASPPYRPNRFHGPADLWLNLTRDDRQIVDSLDQIRARDLAAHLYNAHVLQSQVVPKLGQSEVDATEQDDEMMFNAIEAWTAWPMHSHEVPRADEHIHRLADDNWTFRMKPDSRPSASLEESITTVILRIAKERFLSRKWRKTDRRDRKGPAISGTDGATSGMETDLEGNQPIVEEHLQSKTQADIDMSHPPSYTSEPDDGISATEWEGEPERSHIPLRPVVHLDDDESRRKLRPLARNVIAQLESLLLGLHSFHGAAQSRYDQSNRSQSRGRKRSRSSSVSSSISSAHSRILTAHSRLGIGPHARTKSVQPRSSFSKKTQIKKPKENQSRGRKRTRKTSRSIGRHSAQSEAAAVSKRSHSRSTSTSSEGQPMLTDWKDVAGIASLLGFSPAVLERATERFSALIDEDPEVPTIPQEPDLHYMKTVSHWLSTGSDFATMGRGESLSRPASRSHGSSSRIASNRKRPPSCAAGIHQSPEEESPSLDDNPNRGTALVCPFTKCNRHKKPFSRRWNLNQHLKTMHPGYRPEDNRSQTRSGVQSGYESDISQQRNNKS